MMVERLRNPRLFKMFHKKEAAGATTAPAPTAL